MRRSASEVIRNLEMRIARLERQASNRTASMKIEVEDGLGRLKMMTVKELLSLAKKEAEKVFEGQTVRIYAEGSRSKVVFDCALDAIFTVDMYDLINAIEVDHPEEMQALMRNANVMDDGDALAMAYAVEDWLGTSRGSFGGGLGRDWFVQVI